MNEVTNVTSQARQRDLANLGPGAHQCWYAVALSKDIQKGMTRGVDIADGRIVIYRGEDGVARVMSAYCRHMGADFSIGGDVIGNDIRCPFHHWAYGEGGRCTNIPSGDPIPKTARLASLPVRERGGLIWIFLGEEPLYELQTFDEYDDDENYTLLAFEAKYNQPLLAEPWVFTTNIFDVVHNRVVHGLDIEDPEVEKVSPYLRRMFWKAEHTGEKAQGQWRQQIEVYGTNSIKVRGKWDGRIKWYIACNTPCGREGTRTFFSILTAKGEGDEEFLQNAAATHSRFVNEDLDILNGLRYGDLHLVGADKAMARFIRDVLSYPRITLAELERAASLAGRKGG